MKQIWWNGNDFFCSKEIRGPWIDREAGKKRKEREGGGKRETYIETKLEEARERERERQKIKVLILILPEKMWRKMKEQKLSYKKSARQ